MHHELEKQETAGNPGDSSSSPSPRKYGDPRELWPGREASSRERVIWSVPWSDLMMVMFILFVVLFVFASRDRPLPRLFSTASAHEMAVGHSGPGAVGLLEAEAEAVDLAGVAGKLESELAAYPMVKVNRMAGVGVIVSAAGELIFRPGRAGLTDLGREVFAAVSRGLAMARSQVQVTGFADEESMRAPEYETAWDLAAARAVTVTRDLVESGGLAPELFMVQGFGAKHPVVPETSYGNWIRNQRLEVVVTTIPL